MCASARNVTIPTPPHPNPTPSHDLRSTDHVCKCKERYHPHPTPPQPHPNFIYIYINPLGAGVPGEPQAPRVYIYMHIFGRYLQYNIYICIYFNTKTQIEITIPKHTPNILSGEILKHNKSSPAPVPWKLASFGPQQGWQRNGAHNSNHESSWTTSSIKAGYLNI